MDIQAKQQPQIDRMAALTTPQSCSSNTGPKLSLQRWGHAAMPLSSSRVAIHGGYGRDGKKLRRLDDVVIVSSDGTVAPTASSTPRPKARERHGAAVVKAASSSAAAAPAARSATPGAG